MTRFQWLIGVLVLVLVACAAPATPPSIPTQAPQRSHPPYPETLTAVAVSSVFNPASCATTNAAPPDKFRADEPAKLTAATGKPKLIEFFAYW